MPTTLQASDILKRAHAVGNYYGFAPFSSLAEAKRGQGSKNPFPSECAIDTLDATAKDVVTLLKQASDAGVVPSNSQPLFLWHTNAAAGRPAPKQLTIQFHVLGVENAIADAVLIRAVRALLQDIAKTEPVLRINSMGDKETRSRFARELTQFFRKHGPTLPTDCVDCAKTDVMEAAFMLARAKEEARSLPSPTDHLSEASRRHLESVLEYLETTDTPYELAADLLSHGNAWAETCFDFSVASSALPIEAWGSRHSELSRPFFKGAIHSVSAVIRITTPSRDVIAPVKERAQPRFAFVHIGEEAKRESMKLADDLRKARIPLVQAMGVASLTEQMRRAEHVNPPYLLIMGRKEALEGSVILRERATHTESVISLGSLIDHLRTVA